MRRGFTLIELLIILGLILLLLAFLLPAVAKVRAMSGRATSQNNLKQMALAVHNYHDAHGKMPPTVGRANNADGSLHFHILPFVEQDALFRTAAGASWKNGVHGTVVMVYIDQADKTGPPGHLYQGWLATTNYAANWLAFGKGEKTLVQIPDGTSNTLMFVTRQQLCGGHPTAWGYPSIYYWAPMVGYYTTAKFQHNPPPDACDPAVGQTVGNVMNVALCDGSVRATDLAISPRTWRNLLDTSDGMPLDNDF